MVQARHLYVSASIEEKKLCEEMQKVRAGRDIWRDGKEVVRSANEWVVQLKERQRRQVAYQSLPEKEPAAFAAILSWPNNNW